MNHNDRSSTWCLAHFVQEIANQNFEEFAKSSTSFPRAYQLKDIESNKIALFYSDHDIFTNEKIMKHVIDDLQSNNRTLLDNYKVPCDQWTHMDYIKAKDLGKCVNTRVLQLLNRL
mgnify:CR=1 FL=1